MDDKTKKTCDKVLEIYAYLYEHVGKSLNIELSAKTASRLTDAVLNQEGLDALSKKGRSSSSEVTR